MHLWPCSQIWVQAIPHFIVPRFTIFGDTSSKSMLGYGGIVHARSNLIFTRLIQVTESPGLWPVVPRFLGQVTARGLAHVLDALLTARSRLRESWAWRDGEFQTKGCTNCDIVWHAAVSELIRKAKGFKGLQHVDKGQHFSPRHPEILSISLAWSIRFLEKRILHALCQVVISKKNDRKDHIARKHQRNMKWRLSNFCLSWVHNSKRLEIHFLEHFNMGI